MNIRHDNSMPSAGDVLITSEQGTHNVSVVPNPDRVTFTQFRKAFQLAMQWASEHNGDVWRKTDGVAVRLFRMRETDSRRQS